jgi:catechol 2,3-dioxygenase-like lactoylglutathione lyase family enzyme
MKKKAAGKKSVPRKPGAPAKKRSAVKATKSAKKTASSSKKASSKAAAAKKPTNVTTLVPAAPPADDGKLSFNHAMIYLKDVERGIAFYRDWLGFKLIEDFRHEGKSVYARMLAPGGDGTIALHQAGPGASVASEGVRLYFEVRDLDGFCHKLRKRGFYFTQMPQMMPWGWRHAYLNDPEGHEISLYWAGELRMKKSVMKVARQASAK